MSTVSMAELHTALHSPDLPSDAALQAAAQRATEAPHIVYGGRRYYFSRQLDMFDLAELGEAVEMSETQPMSAIGMINRLLRGWVTEYPQLVAEFRRNHKGVDDAAMGAFGQLASDVFVALTARPTQSPTDCSDGREQTSASSKGDFVSPVSTVPPNQQDAATPG